MDTVSIMWTDEMQHALLALQRQPLARRLLVFAKQRGVELFTVGGALRDICLGRAVEDVDVAMSGDVLAFAREFANHLGAAYVPLDPERGEVRVVYRRRDVLDLARIRGETIITDLQWRDFTINAMACPLVALLTHAAPALIDPHGGWPDLRAHTIRLVSPSGFRDDPLRQLRAFRLAANLDFTIEPMTLAAMEPAAPHLIEVAAERVHRELFRLFAAPSSSAQLTAMARLGLLGILFPELAAVPPSLPYQLGDRLAALEHAILTYQAVEDLISEPVSHLQPIAEAVAKYFQSEERQALVKCAALVHTMGDAALHSDVAVNPITAVTSGEEHTQPWEQIGNRLKLSRKRIDYVKTLIIHYRSMLQLAMLEAQGHLTLRSVHGWCRGVEDSMLGVFVLAIGHALARGPGQTSEPGATLLAQLAPRVWDLYRQRILPVMTAPRLVTGDDLQQVFQLTPSPRFKVLLDELEVAQVEGRVRTRAEALQWVEEQLQ
jgi:poly(A) polymerase